MYLKHLHPVLLVVGFMAVRSTTTCAASVLKSTMRTVSILSNFYIYLSDVMIDTPNELTPMTPRTEYIQPIKETIRELEPSEKEERPTQKNKGRCFSCRSKVSLSYRSHFGY